MNNPIGRKNFGTFAVEFGTGKVKPIKLWYAICPICKEEIRDNGSYGYSYGYSTSTRKRAKDALHYHMRHH